MRDSTAALRAYFAANNTVVAVDLYTFLFAEGGNVRYWDYPLPSLTLTAAELPGSPLSGSGGPYTWVRGPRFARTKLATKVGLEPQECDIDMYPAPQLNAAEPADFIGTLSVQGFATSGGFDGATVEIDRFFMPVGQDGIISAINKSLGAIVWFYGRVADVEVQRSMVKIKVKSLINLLQQQQMPRRLFQAGCTHIYGDAMCGYDRVNGKNAVGTSTGLGAIACTALAGSNQGTLNTSFGGTINSNFVLGTATGTSGANLGVSRGIIVVSGASVSVGPRAFPYAITIGDSFQLLPGCDHTLATCNGVMQNILRYGGFDYIPPPEIAL